MVKGISKQVIVVHAPEPQLFEQAIFILAPGYGGEKLESPEDLLRLADSIAEKYTVDTLRPMRKYRLLPCLLSFLLGGLVTGSILLFLL